MYRLGGHFARIRTNGDRTTLLDRRKQRKLGRHVLLHGCNRRDLQRGRGTGLQRLRFTGVNRLRLTCLQRLRLFECLGSGRCFSRGRLDLNVH